jgi:hypothetical protein
MMVYNIFSIIIAVFPLMYKNVYQFTYTEQKAQEKTVRVTGHSRIVGLQYCTYFMSGFRHLEYAGGFQIFGKFVDP